MNIFPKYVDKSKEKEDIIDYIIRRFSRSSASLSASSYTTEEDIENRKKRILGDRGREV